VPDPATVVGSDEQRRKAFREALFVLKRRIDLFACLPIDGLNRLALCCIAFEEQPKNLQMKHRFSAT
jgi:hypothetical protein